MKRMPDKVVVQFFPDSILATTWWMDSNSTSPTRLSTASTLWDERRIGRLHAVPKVNICNSRYVGDELSQSKGPVLSCGKGFQKHENWNWLSRILGDQPNDSFFIECFLYKLSRWWWYHRSSPERRLSKGMMLYKVPMQSRSLRDRRDC